MRSAGKRGESDRRATTLSGRPPSSRWFAPDAARGFMLLLIAVANAPYWLPAVSTEELPLDSASTAWTLVRGLVVDQREYPLFSLLLGFGCAVLATRLHEDGTDRAAVKRLIRRRGAWMTAFGACHALVFQGDVLGAYGLMLVLLAGPLSDPAPTVRRVLATGLPVMLLVVPILAVGGAAGADGTGTASADGPLAPLLNLGHWALNTPFQLASTLMVPAMMLGTLLPRWAALRDTEGSRARLAALGCGLLLVSAVGALPHALMRAGISPSEPWWALLCHVVTGIVGGLGWLALVASWARPRSGSGSSLLSWQGTRSLTGYLMQTVFFSVLVLVAQLTGTWGWLTPFDGLLIGTAVFALCLAICGWLGTRGEPGPADEALRHLSLARS